MKQAFTLVELLVVVLIIGVLTAVALPQYEKAVEKSRAAEPMTLLSALGKAQEVYYMANGSYATKFSDLDVQIPDSYQPSDKCSLFMSGFVTDCVASQDWAIGIHKYYSYWNTLFAARLQGKYAVKEGNSNQAAWVYLLKIPNDPGQVLPKHEHTLVCDATGDYCKSLFGAKKEVGGWLNSASGGYLFIHHTL